MNAICEDSGDVYTSTYLHAGALHGPNKRFDVGGLMVQSCFIVYRDTIAYLRGDFQSILIQRSNYAEAKVPFGCRWCNRSALGRSFHLR